MQKEPQNDTNILGGNTKLEVLQYYSTFWFNTLF